MATVGLGRKFGPWAFLVTFLLAACDRPLHLQVVLDTSESIAVGAPVYVDSVRAGEVDRVGVEGGERVADLSIRDAAARSSLRVGTVRTPEAGRIQLHTEAVHADAGPLPNGARVPTNSRLGYLVHRYSRGLNLTAAGGTVAAVLLLAAAFRSIVSSVGLILSIALASVATQFIHPYVVPAVESAMQKIAPSGTNSTTAGPGEDANSPIVDGEKAGAIDSVGGGALRSAEGAIIEVMNTRPSPQVVTWCLVFTTCFVAFNLLLGRVSRAWRT